MSELWISIGLYVGALVLSPMLLGIMPRVKAWFAGRQGQPLLQVYYDLARLLRKGAVYSVTTSWVFRFGPLLGLSVMLLALTMLPMLGFPSLLHFSGDLLLFIYLLALARFFLMLAAMDTGSSFEGMGASREAMFSLLAEPTLFLVLTTMLMHTGKLSLSEMFTALNEAAMDIPLHNLMLMAVAFFIVLLVENCRVPFDDPTTHLELTMIHEVMVLDNSGPDFAFITYTACLKLWLTTAILAQIVVPAIPGGATWHRPLLVFCVMLLISMIIGVVESTLARLRLIRLPRLLIGASIIALLAFMVTR
jgi:formate hydrogenlyase subunit 4